MEGKNGTPSNKERILGSIYMAIDQINETLPEEKRINKSLETVLLGPEGSIDSLGLTMLIVAVEQKIEEEFGQVITLVDATAMSEEHSPFQKVEKLVDHIDMLLGEQQNG